MAPVVPGVFTAAEMNKAKITIQEMFAGGFAWQHLNQDCPIFNGLAQRQQLRLNGPGTVLMDGRQCQGIDVSWLNICDLDVSETPLDCDLDGDQLGALGKSYVANQTFYKSVKIEDAQCKNVHDREEKRAMAIATIKATMDQELERRFIAYLMTIADAWDDTSGSLEQLPFGCIDGGDSTIWTLETTDLTADSFIDFGVLVKNINMVSPVLVDGNNFWSALKKAEARASNLAGSNPNTDGGNLDALFQTMPIISNVKVVDVVAGAPTSFLVDTSNVGYFNTIIYPNSAPMKKEDAQNSSVWSIASDKLRWRNGNQLIPVRYDIKYQYQCVGGNDYAEVFSGQHRGAFISGPTNCNEENGVRRLQLGDCTP